MNFFNQNKSHSFNFPKFLVSVEMVVEDGVINFFNQNNFPSFCFAKFLISVEMVVVVWCNTLLQPK